MLVALGDTHRTEDHGLRGRTLEAVRAADVVCHTGDFTTAAVHDAIAAECDALCAVLGNNDEPGLRSRLDERAVVDAEGLTVGLVHGHEHSATALSLFGREVGADLVVFGHSHRPGVEVGTGPALLNPGSHATPRWYRPAYAELERAADGVSGRLVEPDGTVLERFSLDGRDA
jgi:putative phosphoesterase